MKKHVDMSIKNLMVERKNVRVLANASWAISAFGPLISPAPEITPYFSIGSLAFIGLTLYKYLVVDKAIDNNTEFNEFRKIYNEVLDDMVNLSKSIDNKSAIEHYALYQYIINHNLLSCKESDNLFHDIVYDGGMFPGYTLNGHGVCRHQAAMGANFFEKLGFDNNFEACRFSRDYSVDTDLDLIRKMFEKELEEAKEKGSKEDITLCKMLLDSVYETIEELNSQDDKKDKNKNKNNHAVIKVNEGENTYFFDTMQRTFYTASGYNPNILQDYKGKQINIGVALKDKKHFNKISPVIPTNNLLPIGEIRKEYIDSMVKLANNVDVVRKFNKENQDKLERAEEIYIRSLKK